MLALLILLSAGTAATDDRSRGTAIIKPEKPQVKTQVKPVNRPYTFDDYINDLKTSARKDEPKPTNPVTEEESKQVASNKYRDYKPLNPFVIEW
jgi:hypothetical protein